MLQQRRIFRNPFLLMVEHLKQQGEGLLAQPLCKISQQCHPTSRWKVLLGKQDLLPVLVHAAAGLDSSHTLLLALGPYRANYLGKTPFRTTSKSLLCQKARSENSSQDMPVQLCLTIQFFFSGIITQDTPIAAFICRRHGCTEILKERRK